MLRGLPFEYAVRNLGRTPSRLFMSVCGSALVVVLVIAAGGFVHGMTSALRSSGSPRNVILLGAGRAALGVLGSGAAMRCRAPLVRRRAKAPLCALQGP